MFIVDHLIQTFFKSKKAEKKIQISQKRNNLSQQMSQFNNKILNKTDQFLQSEVKCNILNMSHFHKCKNCIGNNIL